MKIAFLKESSMKNFSKTALDGKTVKG